MRFQFWSIGKSNETYVDEGIRTFTRRINNYFPAEWHLIAGPRQAASLTEKELKQKEGELILSRISADDYLILLDEKGRQMSSVSLAEFIGKKAMENRKNLVFLIGGAFGVSEEVRKRANHTWSLSELVFPHQLVRLILSEQIYRACTINRNEKYHHI